MDQTPVLSKGTAKKDRRSHWRATRRNEHLLGGLARAEIAVRRTAPHHTAQIQFSDRLHHSLADAERLLPLSD
jgi:ribosomal protein L18